MSNGSGQQLLSNAEQFSLQLANHTMSLNNEDMDIIRDNIGIQKEMINIAVRITVC